MSSSYTHTLDANGGANDSSALQNPSDDPEEDHNFVCLTCLGECTCGGSPTAMTTTAPSSPPGLTHGTAPTHSFNTTNISHLGNGASNASSKPPLKIKLTLRPPRPPSDTSLDAAHPHKTKYAKHVEMMSASESGGGEVTDHSPFSTLGQPLLPGTQFNADGSIKKKRGRPTKAAIAAREAAAARAAGFASPLSMSGALPDAVTRQTDVRQQFRNVPPVRQASQMKATKANRVTATSRVRPAGKAQLKKRQLAGAAAASRAASIVKKKQRQQVNKKRSVPAWLGADGEESSELSELDDDIASDSARSLQFPTFISAFSTSSSNSSSEDTSDSDSDDEQQNKKPEQEADPAALSPLRKVSSSSQRNNWEIRPRMKSVGAEGTSEEDTDSDSEEEEEIEEEEVTGVGDTDVQDDEGEDTRIDSLIRYAGIATGYTDDDEESSYDADLFFANLTDSSGEDSEDQMGDAENGFGDDEIHDDDMDVVMDHDAFSTFGSMSLPEVAAAGFLAPFGDLERDGVDGLPFEFTHGWDGHVLFSNFLKSDSGFPELSVEVQRAAEHDSDRQLPPNNTDINVLEDADIMMATSEEEEAMALFENDCSLFGDDVDAIEVFEDSDGGETTEDEFVEIDGIATPRNLVDLRFPASLGSINPMSTVSSPVVSPGARGRTLFSPARSARPADILAGRVKRLEESPMETPVASTSASPCRGPTMGSFAAKEGTKRKVVLDSTGRAADGNPAPSPFPVIRRLRRRSDASGNASDPGSAAKSRAPSLLGAHMSPFESIVEDFDSPTKSPELHPTQPIELEEVLDTALLDAEAEGQETSTDASCETDLETRNKHIQNLRRWDRIPMNTFRKSRAAAGVPDIVIPDKMGVASWSSPSSRVPRPADGFSYGSAAGAMLRGSSLSAALFNGEPATETGAVDATSRPKQKRRMTGKDRASILISPLLLPLGDRDGDRTPTNDDQRPYQSYASQQHALLHAANTKSRKELRREKKRQRQVGAGSPASRHLHHQHHHNHFPNGKSRGFNSSQRSFSGSIPTLSL
ncbi:hypothetical protein SCHPADRAFT_936611 [Schizopora paradoxa]|uniref:Uncharacterized protein n=1 Tax=Schizopora paradoxa TaxID=27342 RepID=A0A0H2S8J8_9AGAM|nr:hypothetical protein SCHPADRAFT_936611 [Schizopora paradoxa]